MNMPRHETYTQCRLTRPTKVKGKSGVQVMVTWIPSHLAKKGQKINLKDDLGEWTDGWTVDEVWRTKKGDVVEAGVPAYKHHRERTDI